MCRVRLQFAPIARGVTLIELIVSLAVLAILGGLAAPGFHGMWLDSQRTTAVNAFVHSLWLARSSAITSGRTITVCRSVDGRTCSDQLEDWQSGWIVFLNADDDQPPERDADETVLSAFQAWRGGSISSNRRSYSFRPDFHRVVNGAVVFCDRRGSAHARAVIVNSAGRPRVSSRDSNDRPLRCPNG